MNSRARGATPSPERAGMGSRRRQEAVRQGEAPVDPSRRLGGRVRGNRAGLLSLLALLCLGFPGVWAAERPSPRARDVDPDDHAFPALGMPVARKVPVAWNQFYDCKGLEGILARLHKAFPRLTRLYSLGQSVEGRELWCLEVTSPEGGPAERKPGMYIDGNIHGNEVQGSEVVAYTAWYLCHQYGQLDKVTDLLDHYVFYLVPTINPDGRDHWFHRAHNTHTSRTGVKPLDSDRDGTSDEDDYDDLDGDGSITQMRMRDPRGDHREHPQFPNVMIRVGPEETGDFILLGSEGLDNDGDGQVNEDPVGGYDMNRNWGWDWQPGYIQGGAHEYPFSLPETRAVADFILDRSNLAAFQSYHNFGGMILRGPGRAGGNIQGGDERVLQTIAARGEKIMPFYRSMIIHRDLYTVWGGEVDWLYSGRGILGFTDEIWNLRSLGKGAENPSSEEQAHFLRYVMLDEGVVPWTAFDHPTYGPIEIGGYRKQWFRTPVSFLLEEECHRNMAFSLYHADQMPRLSIEEVEMERLAEGLYRVWISVRNDRMIPTRTQQDVRNHISPPDRVTVEGPRIQVLSSGEVTDRFFKRVKPTERRPERVELDSIRGRETARIQFLIEGEGRFTVTVDSAKGGLLEAQQELP